MPCTGLEEVVYTCVPGKVDEIAISDPEGAETRRGSDSFSWVGCQVRHHAAPLLLQTDLGQRPVSREMAPGWNET